MAGITQGDLGRLPAVVVGAVVGGVGSWWVTRGQVMARKDVCLYAEPPRRRWLLRTIQITGTVEAVVEYDARGMAPVPICREAVMETLVEALTGKDQPPPPEEILRINGNTVDAWREGDVEGRHVLSFRTPRRLRGRSNIEVELSTDGVIGIRYFKLTIANQVLYEEQGGKVTQVKRRLPLPIAAKAPPPDVDTLPIVSDPTPGAGG